jgi:hypothetical protein
MTIAYAVTNAFGSLAAAAFTWSTADTTNRSYLNDGRMDRQFNVSNAASGLTLVINMGSAQSLCGIATLNSNVALATGTPALRVRAADDAGITVNVITPKAASNLNTTAPKQKDHVLQWAASAAKQYWELTWTWTGNYQLKIGEVFAFASSTQLSRSSVYGSGEGEFFKVAQNDMQSGEPRAVFIAGPVRRFMLRWKDHSATERDQLRTMWRATKGPVTPFLYIPSYEAVSTAAATTEQEVLYGKLMLTDFDFTQPDFNLFDPPDLQLVSLGREVGS